MALAGNRDVSMALENLAKIIATEHYLPMAASS
jgi:hypothetical protein